MYLIEWLYDRKNAKQQEEIIESMSARENVFSYVLHNGTVIHTLDLSKLAFLRISLAPEPYVAPPLREVNDVG